MLRSVSIILRQAVPACPRLMVFSVHSPTNALAVNQKEDTVIYGVEGSPDLKFKLRPQEILYKVTFDWPLLLQEYNMYIDNFKVMQLGKVEMFWTLKGKQFVD